MFKNIRPVCKPTVLAKEAATMFAKKKELPDSNPKHEADFHKSPDIHKAAVKLMTELEKGRSSGEKEGWYSLEEIRKEFVSTQWLYRSLS
jgi:hypothetical protein